jgi:hypothetical protein
VNGRRLVKRDGGQRDEALHPLSYFLPSDLWEGNLINPGPPNSMSGQPRRAESQASAAVLANGTRLVRREYGR